MEIRSPHQIHSTDPANYSSNPLALKKDLHDALNHFNQQIEQLLQNPDHIDEHFAKDFADSIMKLDQLSKAATSKEIQNKSDLANTLSDAGTIVQNVLGAPVYV